MRDLYKIFDKLLEKDITFVFQRQSKANYYNMAIAAPKGKEHDTLSTQKLTIIGAETRYLHSPNLEDIEKDLKILYGHLLEEESKPAGLPIPTMPLPPGM